MELSETAWKWIVGTGLLLAIAGARLLKARRERLRRAWFDGVASALGTTATHEALRSECRATVAGRPVEISDNTYLVLRTRRSGSRRTITSSTPLTGVSDIYNLVFHRDDESLVRAETFGVQPRAGWLTYKVREGLARVLEVGDRYDVLDVEGGRLRFLMGRDYDPATIRLIVERQVEAAEMLERALNA